MRDEQEQEAAEETIDEMYERMMKEVDEEMTAEKAAQVAADEAAVVAMAAERRRVGSVIAVLVAELEECEGRVEEAELQTWLRSRVKGKMMGSGRQGWYGCAHVWCVMMVWKGGTW